VLGKSQTVGIIPLDEVAHSKNWQTIKPGAVVKQSEVRGELGNELFPYQGAGEPQICGNLRSRSTAHLLPERRWVRASLLP
jgi:hypothetical protein